MTTFKNLDSKVNGNFLWKTGSCYFQDSNFDNVYLSRSDIMREVKKTYSKSSSRMRGLENFKNQVFIRLIDNKYWSVSCAVGNKI